MKATSLCLPLAAVCFVMLSTGPRAGGVTLGQVDTFGANVQGWFGGNGGGAGPQRITSGGPGGAGDAYMRWSATSTPIGAKNESQWSGDYLAAGVEAIELDINNFGGTELAMRLVLFHTSDAIAWSSTEAVAVAPFSGWTHIVLSLAPADLTNILIPGALVTTPPYNTPEFTLGDSLRLLIRHDPGDGTPGAGPSLVGENPNGFVGSVGNPYTIGVDNIRASMAVIPEPSRLALLVTSAMVLGFARRRSRFGRVIE
jgi:hypothetical protein